MVTKPSKSEETYAKILEAATVQFLLNGYAQTTTREIAKALKITQPTIYHHFGDKETLFVEVIKRVGNQVMTDMMAILDQTYPQPVDQLVALTEVIITRHPRDVFSLIHGSFDTLSPQHQQELGMVFGRNYVMPIAQFFSQEVVPLREGIDSKMASSFFITSLSPLFSDFHALNGTTTMHERIQQLLDLILYGLLNR